jgi:hypothetical protein
MDKIELNKDDIIDSLRKMNRELMEENDYLRKQIVALEELAIDSTVGYNEDPLEEWEEIDFNE